MEFVVSVQQDSTLTRVEFVGQFLPVAATMTQSNTSALGAIQGIALTPIKPV